MRLQGFFVWKFPPKFSKPIGFKKIKTKQHEKTEKMSLDKILFGNLTKSAILFDFGWILLAIFELHVMFTVSET